LNYEVKILPDFDWSKSEPDAYNQSGGVYVVGPKLDVIAVVRDRIGQDSDRHAPYELSYKVYKGSTVAIPEKTNIKFDRIPSNSLVKAIYAEESHIIDKAYYNKETTFRYIVTNSTSGNKCIDADAVKKGCGSGEYGVDIIVEDTSGNKSIKTTKILIPELPIITEEQPIGDIDISTPVISAIVESMDNIKISSAVMRLDGAQVDSYTINGGTLTKIELAHVPTSLAIGTHTVKVTAIDVLGWEAEPKEWKFYYTGIKSLIIEAESADNNFVDCKEENGWMKIGGDVKLTSVGVFGSHGSGAGQLKNPRQIAVDNDLNVYITEQYPHRVKKLATDGTIDIFKEWASNQGQPYGIDTDANGNVYVTHTVRYGYVEKYDCYGVFKSSWGHEGSWSDTLHYPSSIAVSEWEDIYVAASTYYIFQYTMGGDLIKKSQFIQKSSVLSVDTAIDTQGNVYATYFGRWNQPEWPLVRKFDENLNLLFSWGQNGSGDGELKEPSGIAVDDNGNVYVADTGNYRLQKFTSNGEFIYEKKMEYYRQPPTYAYIKPMDIEVDKDGNLWVAETGWDGVNEISQIEKFEESVPDQGIITTAFYEFTDLISYAGIIPTESIEISTAQFISYEYSTDGTSWHGVPDDKSLVGVSTATERIKFRITLSREEGYESPALDKIELEYIGANGTVITTVSSGGGSGSGGSMANALSAFTNNENDDEFREGEIYVFPNPAKQKDPTFHFELANADKIHLRIYNINAELLYEKEIMKPEDTYECNWDTSEIPSGVYIYIVKAIKEEKTVSKVMKKLALIK
jgi:sugar lactone lactonase YvrE